MPSRCTFRLSLSTQVLIGLILGLLAGVIFGDLMAPLQDVGKAFILLLQMTVLPYITLSLITGLGHLTYAQVKTLALKAGAVLILLWVLALAAILVMPLAFPVWESAAFFSTSLIDKPEEVNFLTLFIPSNPFYSFANNIVPAVVLFSVTLGLALIGIEQKQAILGPLAVLNRAVTQVTTFVAKLTPIGVFAVVASAAGTMRLEDAGKLQVYLVTYVAMAFVLTLWVLPAVITSCTPLTYQQVVGQTRDVLVTAFAIAPAAIQEKETIFARHAGERIANRSLQKTHQARGACARLGRGCVWDTTRVGAGRGHGAAQHAPQEALPGRTAGLQDVSHCQTLGQEVHTTVWPQRAGAQIEGPVAAIEQPGVRITGRGKEGHGAHTLRSHTHGRQPPMGMRARQVLHEWPVFGVQGPGHECFECGPGAPHDLSGVIDAPMCAAPDQPLPPGIAISQVLSMGRHEGLGVIDIGVGGGRYGRGTDARAALWLDSDAVRGSPGRIAQATGCDAVDFLSGQGWEALGRIDRLQGGADGLAGKPARPHGAAEQE